MILTQQPALFDRVFQKLFTEEIAEAAESVPLRALAVNKEEPAAWVFQRLWDRNSGQPASLVPRPQAAMASSLGLSRYETDFQVWSSLKPALPTYIVRMLRARLAGSSKRASRPNSCRQGVLAPMHENLHKSGLSGSRQAIHVNETCHYCRSCVRWAKAVTASWSQL